VKKERRPLKGALYGVNATALASKARIILYLYLEQIEQHATGHSASRIPRMNRVTKEDAEFAVQVLRLADSIRKKKPAAAKKKPPAEDPDQPAGPDLSDVPLEDLLKVTA
jgi:hypothetical protein